MGPELTFWATVLCFSVTYLGLAIGRLPGLRTDRTGVALVGAAGVLAMRLSTFQEAVEAVDFATIVLLLGMMIVVAFLNRSGLFLLLGSGLLQKFRRPTALLAVVMGMSGVLSALLVNDVVCLALAPLVLHVTRRVHLDPRPHLIGLAVASNVGSVATLTGNPQNMIIGGLSHISYARFSAKLAPVAVLGLLAAYFICRIAWRSELAKEPAAPQPHRTPKRIRLRSSHWMLMLRSLFVAVAAIGLFLAGYPMEIVALGAAAVLLLGNVNPKSVYDQIDWGLLVMFAGLFVVVHTFQVHVVSRWNIAGWAGVARDPILALSAASAVLSNVVSNVPAVLLFKPIVAGLPPLVQEDAWLALAMSSTFAGNLTIVGSVANLIVVERARREGQAITLREYCRVGVPTTLVTLVLGVAWLMLARY